MSIKIIENMVKWVEENLEIYAGVEAELSIKNVMSLLMKSYHGIKPKGALFHLEKL
ncbi:MAG: hypothetical protein E6942_17045 [Clostridium argentinense]|nr:hypothetical protein [Clostridium argentinense]